MIPHLASDATIWHLAKSTKRNVNVDTVPGPIMWKHDVIYKTGST